MTDVDDIWMPACAGMTKQSEATWTEFALARQGLVDGLDDRINLMRIDAETRMKLTRVKPLAGFTDTVAERRELGARHLHLILAIGQAGGVQGVGWLAAERSAKIVMQRLDSTPVKANRVFEVRNLKLTSSLKHAVANPDKITSRQDDAEGIR